VVTSTSLYVSNAAAKTPITARLYCLLEPREMEVIPGGQPVAAGRKLSIITLDSARSLGEISRKEQTFVRMGHVVRRGNPHTAGVRLRKCECYMTWYGKRTTKIRGRSDVSSYIYD